MVHALHLVVSSLAFCRELPCRSKITCLLWSEVILWETMSRNVSSFKDERSTVPSQNRPSLVLVKSECQTGWSVKGMAEETHRSIVHLHFGLCLVLCMSGSGSGRLQTFYSRLPCSGVRCHCSLKSSKLFWREWSYPNCFEFKERQQWRHKAMVHRRYPL